MMSRNRSGWRRRVSGQGKPGCLGLIVCLVLGVCDADSRDEAEPDLDALAKIRFDLSALRADGLLGPADGLRALDYEFCIPLHAVYWQRVAAIDASARRYPDSPGRVGCGAEETLVIGNTHQEGFRTVLHRLARLPFVRRIEPVWFE